MTINFDDIKSKLGVKSVSAVAKLAGIPVSTLVDTANGRSKTLSAENAQKLADCVGVTVDELYGIKKEKASDTEVSEAKSKILSLFGSMTDEQQQLILRLAESIVEQRSKDE